MSANADAQAHVEQEASTSTTSYAATYRVVISELTEVQLLG